MEDRIAYFNGRFMSIDKIRISPNDRGFLFADGVYEVIRSYKGKLFMYNEHIDRLKYSLSELKINFHNTASLKGIILELLRRNKLENVDATTYIQITRGEYERMLKFPPADVPPTVYIVPKPIQLDEQTIIKGIKAVSVEDVRWGRCDIKTVALLPNALAHQQAIEQGADIGLFTKDGNITEGTHVSVFGVKNGSLITYPAGKHILPSITRKVVKQLCEELNLELIEKAISLDSISDIDELFVVGTTPEITPVISVNDIIIANGKPGNITLMLQKAFNRFVGEL